MKKRLSGFTLVELIVVVAIIAVLAALIVPRLDGLLGNANHAAAASSAADAAKFIEVYKSSKYAYPDGYDSLMDSTGTNLWAASTPTSKGLHTELSGPSAKLTADTLTPAEITGLNNAGIYNLMNLDGTVATNTRPGDAFNTKVPIASGQKVAFVNPTNGAKIIDHIYRDNKLNGGLNTGILPAGSRLAAFGLGPHNAMIGKWMLEAPQYGNVDVTVTYNRLLVIYELATTTSGTTSTTKVSFKAVIGADGDLMDDMAASVNKSIN